MFASPQSFGENPLSFVIQTSLHHSKPQKTLAGFKFFSYDLA
jgi:hypothetical protein